MVLTEEQVKKIQSIEKDMLIKVIQVCDLLKLKYYFIGGSLLGAVRHGGFIPWDDDVDIGILRKDYEVFIEKAPELLPHEYFVQTYKSDNTIFSFAKVRNSNTTYIEERNKHIDMNHGAWIDIFPFDYSSNNRFLNSLLKVRIAFADIRIGCEESGANKKSLIKSMAEFLSKLRFRRLKKAVAYKDKLYAHVKKSNLIVNYSGAYMDKEVVDKTWFGEGDFLEFERMKVRAPKEYKKYLNQIYGDFMKLPPEESRIPQHNIAVIDLERSYKEHIGER